MNGPPKLDWSLEGANPVWVVWIVEGREGGDMMLPLHVNAVTASAKAGKKLAEVGLHPSVKARRVWRCDRFGQWAMYWNRRPNAAIVARVRAHKIRT